MQGQENLANEFSHLQQAVLQTLLSWEEQAVNTKIAMQGELQLRDVLTEKYNTDNRSSDIAGFHHWSSHA